VRGGNILIAVHPEDRSELARARDILERHAARDIAYTGEAGVSREARA
jgi:hypothetical protein